MSSETPLDEEAVGPTFTTPGLFSCPPLVQLQAYGICCGIFETEEDNEARIGAQLLTNYPITWYRKQQITQKSTNDDNEENKTDNKSISEGGFIDGLVTSVDKIFGKVTGKETFSAVPATLSIIDTEQCGPVIQVKATKGGKQQFDTSVVENNDKEWWDEEQKKMTKLPSFSIPLYLVDSVSAGWSFIGDNTEGGVKIFARNQSSKGLIGRGSGEELLRFDTLGGGGDDWSEAIFPIKSTEPNEHADKIITRLRALIDWNRNRMAEDVKEGKLCVMLSN